MHRFPRLTWLVAVSGCLLLAVACTAGGGPGWTYAPLGPTPTAAAATSTPAGSPAAPGNVVDLELTGNLTILRDGVQLTELHVTDGETYVFRVDNSAGFTHDFYLGPADRLAANDVSGLPGIEKWDEGPREFSWTASHEADNWEFACTVLGHYASMHGSLIVDDSTAE